MTEFQDFMDAVNFLHMDDVTDDESSAALPSVWLSRRMSRVHRQFQHVAAGIPGLDETFHSFDHARLNGNISKVSRSFEQAALLYDKLGELEVRYQRARQDPATPHSRIMMLQNEIAVYGKFADMFSYYFWSKYDEADLQLIQLEDMIFNNAQNSEAEREENLPTEN